MDKILSARVDESVVHLLGLLSRQLKKSKKAILEAAIRSYAETVEEEATEGHPFERTLGAWARPGETAGQTRETIRAEFRRSMERHRR